MGTALPKVRIRIDHTPDGSIAFGFVRSTTRGLDVTPGQVHSIRHALACPSCTHPRPILAVDTPVAWLRGGGGALMVNGYWGDIGDVGERWGDSS